MIFLLKYNKLLTNKGLSIYLNGSGFQQIDASDKG